MRGLILLLVALLPLSSMADSGLPFLKDMAGDRDLPRPWGIGFDFYTMDQDYDIKSLNFALPGVSIGDPNDIKVTNEVKHYDIQADAWILPFLNVFGIVGRVSIDTLVDFSQAEITPPIPLGTVPVSFNGTVWGGGFTLAYGTERWFTSVTTTFTKTSTSGDLDSKVNSTSVQPRIGLLRNGFRFWVGGMYLDTDEKHSGIFDLGLPGLDSIPFEVELKSKDNWNYAVGAGYVFNDRFNLSLEAGFGNRTHSLFNFNFRF
ncbi:MAG: hypothetical protein QNK22_07115 [Xanthomonadales bacterium]|nr:hypothetical protein [Xanthomonadales bacterium]